MVWRCEFDSKSEISKFGDHLIGGRKCVCWWCASDVIQIVVISGFDGRSMLKLFLHNQSEGHLGGVDGYKELYLKCL